MHAALALGELRAQEATPDLVATLEDPDENVRFHAIEALGRIGAAESIGPLATDRRLRQLLPGLRGRSTR